MYWQITCSLSSTCSESGSTEGAQSLSSDKSVVNLQRGDRTRKKHRIEFLVGETSVSWQRLSTDGQ